MSAPTAFSLQSTPLDAGVTLLEASAGTGKTFTIAGIVTRLIALNDLPIKEILIVTFTEAATRELRDRIRKRLVLVAKELGDQTTSDPVTEALRNSGVEVELLRRRLALALVSFDESSISTIHGFCQRILRDHAFEGDAPFEAEILTDTADLFVDLAHDFWHHTLRPASTILAAAVEHQGISPDYLAKLLVRLSRYPTLTVLPSVRKSFAQTSVAAEKAFEAVIGAWKTEGARLCALIATHKSISKNKKDGFSEHRLGTFRAALDRSARCDRATETSLEAIEAFSEEAIDEQRLTSKTALSNPFPHDAFFSLCSTFIAARKEWIASLRSEWLKFAKSELPKIKAGRRIITFDDMLTLTHSALRGPQASALVNAVRKQYRAALIDEFQDTDPLQYEIFRCFFGTAPHRLMLIGDPKQSIYGFRGADLFTYLEARKDAERASQPRVHTLDTNYRSASNLVAAVNALFSYKPDCFLQPGMTFMPAKADGKAAEKAPLQSGDRRSEPPMVLVEAPIEDRDDQVTELRRRIAKDIATEISKLLKSHQLGTRPVTAADMAILVRSHREAVLIEDVLRSAKIPAVRHTDASVFHTAEAQELLRVLSAVLEPTNERVVRTALATSWLGCSASDIARLEDDAVALAHWLTLFSELRQRWITRGFSTMFRHLLIVEHGRKKLAEQIGGERKLTNLLQLGELAQHAEQQLRLSPVGLIEWIREQRRHEKTTSDEHVQRLEKDDDAVKIVTIHNSKGLEYPIVFCPSHWTDKKAKEILFHDPSQNSQLTLDLSEPPINEHAALAACEALAEEVRLFYVAVTRAVHRCYLYVPQRKDPSKTALGVVLGNDLRGACQTLAERTPSHFELRSLHRVQERSTEVISGEPPALRARELVRRPSSERMIGSFSQWVGGVSDEVPQDHDAIGEPSVTRDDVLADTTPLARLPRGAATGIALHAVLEHADFQHVETLTPLIAQHFGSMIGDTQVLDNVTEHLSAMMSHPLRTTAHQLQLKDIALTDRLNEIEFYYPIKRFDPKVLASATAINSSRFQFSPVDGFLRGFMDLVFRHDDRYYLLDWKSNWLGPTSSAYSRDRLDHVMIRSLYSLQSWLYALALDRFLAQRIPDYQYERDFGGVFYVFVRGLDLKTPEHGVHFSKPEPAFIQKLGDTLLRPGAVR
ncbi:MAG: exodeoxyribonuclease V subunit beta [Gammaproteobacteria bacterium]